MKITGVRTIALSGGTHDTGWPGGTAPSEQMNTEYQTGVPYIEELISPAFRLDGDGMLAVPTGPGLGIQLDPDAVAKYSR